MISRTIAICSWLLAIDLHGQVALDVPLHFTGPEQHRGVDGLAPPTTPTSLLNVGFATSGAAHWVQATMANDTLELTVPLASPVLTTGTLLRFATPAALMEHVWVRPGAYAPVPLLSADGQPVDLRRLRAGAVCEVVFMAGQAYLTAPAIVGCPIGSVPVSDRLCIDITDGPMEDFYDAVDHCTRAGGRLCAWDEYYIACTRVGDQLIDLFDNWEWIDDTANHTHTVAQAGRNTCISVRSTNINPNQQGRRRCCYTIP